MSLSVHRSTNQHPDLIILSVKSWLTHPQTNRYYISPSPGLIDKQNKPETSEANQRPATISSSKFSRVFLLFWCCAPSDAEHSGLQLFRFGHFLHCYIYARLIDFLLTIEHNAITISNVRRLLYCCNPPPPRNICANNTTAAANNQTWTLFSSFSLFFTFARPPNGLGRESITRQKGFLSLFLLLCFFPSIDI